MDRRVIRFDGWKVDFSSGEISKGGVTHRLQDQPLQILDELVKQPGEVVTREQLIARLWPKGVVEYDTGLNSAMRKLRVALGDDAETPRYIETLPRRGYRRPEFRAFFQPQPKSIPWIRRVAPHISYNSFWGFDEQRQSESWHIHPFEIQPRQGGRFGPGMLGRPFWWYASNTSWPT